MLVFEGIYATACERKGGEAALQTLLAKPLTPNQLRTIPDAEYLSALCKKIFQSGFVWRVVENKWDNFAELFWDFDIDKLLMMPDDMLERKARDPRIIRNLRKVWAIRDNAMMISETRRKHGGSFADFVAGWPATDITGLWTYLKRHGNRLGGNTGPYALRALGVDTFLLTRDVEGYLRAHNIVTTGTGSKSALAATQRFFNQLQQESGLSMTELSQLLAYSYGDNTIMAE
jgi:3-methyladenine DNA glycosylase Tag